jgi:hypothetical protein
LKKDKKPKKTSSKFKAECESEFVNLSIKVDEISKELIGKNVEVASYKRENDSLRKDNHVG